MTRITTTILVVLLLMNGVANIMTASGLSEDLGVELNPGGEKAMNEVTNEMQNAFRPGVGAVESLISLVTAGMSLFQTVIHGFYAAPAMLKNLLGGGSLVGTIVDALFLPAYLVSMMEMLYLAVGRDMV